MKEVCVCMHLQSLWGHKWCRQERRNGCSRVRLRKFVCSSTVRTLTHAMGSKNKAKCAGNPRCTRIHETAMLPLTSDALVVCASGCFCCFVGTQIVAALLRSEQEERECAVSAPCVCRLRSAVQRAAHSPPSCALVRENKKSECMEERGVCAVVSLPPALLVIGSFVLDMYLLSLLCAVWDLSLTLRSFNVCVWVCMCVYLLCGATFASSLFAVCVCCICECSTFPFFARMSPACLCSCRWACMSHYFLCVCAYVWLIKRVRSHKDVSADAPE